MYRFQAHVDALLKIPGAELVFGGDYIPAAEHSIPNRYGSWKPTAIKVIHANAQ